MNFRLYLARLIFNIYLLWFAMGSRANTIAHANMPDQDGNYNLRNSVAETIDFGARLAFLNCKEQFKWERWNCPKFSFSKKFHVPITREIAFVSSITAAGIVYSVAKGCSKGVITTCSCKAGSELKMPVEMVWVWGGCSEDISTGNLVSETFLDYLEAGAADVQAIVNRHNTKLGRIVVHQNLKHHCKCHGISGACTVKSCWNIIEPFNHIATELKRRYRKSQRIQVNSVNKISTLFIPEHKMVFLGDSPDYCKDNATIGWRGTGARICSRRSKNITEKSEKRSCKELCRNCGHQVKKRAVKIKWNCKCVFQWCCSVNCEICEKTVKEYYCDDAPKQY